MNPSTNHNLSENSNHPRTFYAVDNVALHFSFFAPQPDMHVFSLADFLDDCAPNAYRDAAFETALDAASYVLNSLLLSVEGVFVFSEWAFFLSPRNFFLTDERLFIYLVPTTFLPFIFEQKHDIDSPLPHSVLKRQFTYVARMLSFDSEVPQFRKSEETCMYMHFGASFMRIHSPDCPNVVGSGMLHYQGIYCFYFS